MQFKIFFLLIYILTISNMLCAQEELEVLSEVMLFSDGPDGVETYQLIQSKFGTGCIEAPDLYGVNHPDEKHIVELTDDWVGNHFVFKIHKNDDFDRDTGKTDRQRNEIKTYDNSPNNTKGFKGETMRYHWYFKLQDGFTISQNFSHFFQFKAVGGDDASQPIITISGSINSANKEFEIIHNAGNNASDKQLTNTDWSVANTGEWMEIEVIAKFADDGYLKMTINDLWGNELMMVERENIDLWRTGSRFVRPKWGIYRSLKSKQYLSEEEEQAGFANFIIQKLGVSESNSANEQIQGIGVYPNPATDWISINFNKPQTESLLVFTSNGQYLSQFTVQNQNQLHVDVSDWNPGVYLLFSPENQSYQRLIKR